MIELAILAAQAEGIRIAKEQAAAKADAEELRLQTIENRLASLEAAAEKATRIASLLSKKHNELAAIVRQQGALISQLQARRQTNSTPRPSRMPDALDMRLEQELLD